MALTLPKLPYAYDALEPYIDARTMEIHHTKHHQAYIDKANAALQKYPELAAKGLDALARDLASVPEDVRMVLRNNGGGHWNHSLFWEVMGPHKGGEPAGDLAAAIQKQFAGFAAFRDQFTAAGINRFGSGWAWLGVKPDGSLCVCSTPNQDNPLMQGVVDCLCSPILGLDVWEHAYYLKYQNRRPDYIAAWWNVVNWGKVGELYARSKKG